MKRSLKPWPLNLKSGSWILVWTNTGKTLKLLGIFEYVLDDTKTYCWFLLDVIMAVGKKANVCTWERKCAGRKRDDRDLLENDWEIFLRNEV